MKMIIGGDVCPTIGNAEMFDKVQTKELFNDVLDVFKSADINLVNLECALTDSENAIKKYGPNLKAPKNTAAVLKEAGITHCGLSNNHTFDFGIEGLRDTMKALEENGIEYTGVGENDIDARRDMIIEKEGEKIAVITVCEHEYSYALPDRIGAREYDPYDTNDDIKKAKENADFVIVLYHGGKEQCRYPSPRLLKLCRSMAKHGADVVICQHSHCIGCYENFEGCHILYGQGNFHFTGKYNLSDDMWHTGTLVQLDINDKIDISFIPTRATGAPIELAKGEDKENLLKELDERNCELADGRWIDGWRAFCEMKKPNYLGPLENKDFDWFSHYLDCEAHTDVWRELFKTWNHTNEK